MKRFETNRLCPLFFAGLILAGLLTGCAGLRATSPKGFATYDKCCFFSQSESFRAVSPEGVVYRKRKLDNDPFASISFWSEAVLTRMEKSGYKVLRDSTLVTQTGTGDSTRVFELAAPLGVHDYGYLIALQTTPDHIFITEAAGPLETFQERRNEIYAGLMDSSK